MKSNHKESIAKLLMLFPILMIVALLMVAMIIVSFTVAYGIQQYFLIALFLFILMLVIGSELVLWCGRRLIRWNFSASRFSSKEKHPEDYPMPEEVAWLKEQESS